MDAQDFRSLQEAYIGVYDDDIREKLEFESWVNNLLEEGYDLSDYTWEELYENYTQLDESGLSQATIQSAVIKRQKRNDAELAKDTPEGDAAYNRGRQKVKRSKSQLDINKKFSREGPTVRIQREALNNSYDQQLDEISDRLANAAIKSRTKRTDRLQSSASSILPRSDSAQNTIDNKVTRSRNKEAKVNDTIASRNKRTGSNIERIDNRRHESYDLYDIILSHLIDEGYADTNENALVIMANMSEEWRDSIVEEKIVKSGVSVNAAGQKIPWTHSHNTATGKSTVKDKFGKRDASVSAKIKPKMD